MSEKLSITLNRTFTITTIITMQLISLNTRCLSRPDFPSTGQRPSTKDARESQCQGTVAALTPVTGHICQDNLDSAENTTT